MAWQSKHFKPKELLSPDGLEQLKKHGWVKCQQFAIDGLNDWREFVDVAISVNFGMAQRRGYRSELENRQVGGVPNSPHTQGIAFDQTPHNYPLFDFYVLAVYWSILRFKEEKFGFGALGLYPQSNFMHGDFRNNFDNNLVLWNGHKKTLLTKVVKFDNIPLDTLDSWIIETLGLPNWKLQRFTIDELLKREL